MKRLSVLIWITLCVGIMTSCKKDSPAVRSQTDIALAANYISDEYGRQLILHGLNTASNSKGDVNRMPWIIESDVEREDKEFGFNFVRFLIFWDFVEPQRGVFNSDYLDEVQKRVEWYTSRGMHVMLDMHQDLYSLKFGGDGAPNWAVKTDGNIDLDFGEDTPWWLANISPAVVKAWTNFWEYSKYKDLQDHYALMWKFVMERFENNPGVIGYDLMNEPWAGDLMKAFITGNFERYQLTAFYNRLIPQLREVEPNKYFFYESAPAPVTFGMPTNLQKLDPSIAKDKLVFAPHCYPLGTHEGKPYDASNKKMFKDWVRERKKDTKRFGNLSLLCGEFGLSPGVKDFDVYLKDFGKAMDDNLWHWAYWSNDQGGWSPLNGDRTPTAILPFLVRAYPKATAGRIQSFSYDYDTKIFTMDFVSDPNISMPTEIFIPKMHFTQGFDISIETDAPHTYEYDEQTQVLSLKVEKKAEVKVLISAK